MYWTDEGYLLSKNNFGENSIIVEAFTLKHGRYTGIVYGGSSRKQKSNFQIGNKILLNWKSKGENRSGYFNIDVADSIQVDFFLSSKKNGETGSINSTLKYPVLFIFLDFQLSKILFPI